MISLNDIYLKFERRWAYTNTRRFIAYLRKKGIVIGDNILIIDGDLKTIEIDLTRPSLIEIGNNVRLNKNLTILSHDFTTYVFRNKYHEFIPCSGQVKIGNNVYFGRNCTVLKGVTIGDNCIIGFGSVVTNDIPSNTVAIGSPAKAVCTLEEYYERRKKLCIEEAFAYAKSIKNRFHRQPVIEDFWEEFPLFLDGHEDCPKIPIKAQLNGAYEEYKKNHKSVFKGFGDFLEKANIGE